jgi:hypothetical protein
LPTVKGGAEVGPAAVSVHRAAGAAAGDRHPVGRLGLAGVQLVVQLDLVPGHPAVVAFEVAQPVGHLFSVGLAHFHVAACHHDYQFGADDGLRRVVGAGLVLAT